MSKNHVIPTCLLVVPIFLTLVAGCRRSIPLSPDEVAYLERVAMVDVPLRLEPDDLDTVMARAVDWITRFSVYRITSRGYNFVETETPRTAAEGGIGYRVEANVFDNVLTVDITALRPDRSDGRYPVPDPTAERMLGLYILEGVLPPGGRVGFNVGG